ncbi:MAG: hypothetical protein QNJ45_11885 [Ardenticatenaceae bacterium]|nr:hypothetical protein [Ardenticatenaceae bacterium]
MKKFFERLGIFPFLLLGIGFFVLGLAALNYLTNNIWPIDVERLDLIRAIAANQVNPAALLEAAYPEVILAFLASVSLTFIGLTMPIAYILNRRFMRAYPGFMAVMRQGLWAGLWVAFCVWLQMNRTFGIAVAVLVATIFVLLEIMLQVRKRTQEQPF